MMKSVRERARKERNREREKTVESKKMWEWDKIKWNFDRLTFTQKTNKIKRQKETF
jgi:hypothetical protein